MRFPHRSRSRWRCWGPGWSGWGYFGAAGKLIARCAVTPARLRQASHVRLHPLRKGMVVAFAGVGVRGRDGWSGYDDNDLWGAALTGAALLLVSVATRNPQQHPE